MICGGYTRAVWGLDHNSHECCKDKQSSNDEGRLEQDLFKTAPFGKRRCRCISSEATAYARTAFLHEDGNNEEDGENDLNVRQGAEKEIHVTDEYSRGVGSCHDPSGQGRKTIYGVIWLKHRR